MHPSRYFIRVLCHHFGLVVASWSYVDNKGTRRSFTVFVRSVYKMYGIIYSERLRRRIFAQKGDEGRQRRREVVRGSPGRRMNSPMQEAKSVARCSFIIEMHPEGTPCQSSFTESESAAEFFGYSWRRGPQTSGR